jgi:tight adherence protein B
MNGPTVGALLSALALLVLPASPAGRLRSVRRKPLLLKPAGAGWVATGGVGLATLVLPLTTVLAVAVVVGTAALRHRRRRRLRSAEQEGRALQAALDVLVGELRVGVHPVRAFEVAAAETVGGVAISMRGVAARARLGADVAAGLRAAAGSSVLPTQWDRLASCWQLASEHGLAIATLMRAAQRDIVDRQRFSAQVSSGMAGARATAAILAGLPALGVVLGEVIGARPVRFLFGGHGGGWLLLVGSTLACCGLLWSDRITDRVA